MEPETVRLPSRFLWGGYSAKHYQDEATKHKEFYAVKYPTPKEAAKYVKKLKRHFKLSFDFEFTNYSRGMAYHAFGYCYKIKLPTENISLGLICHEVAHALAWKKYRKEVSHNRKYQRQCDRVCKWAKKYLPKPI